MMDLKKIKSGLELYEIIQRVVENNDRFFTVCGCDFIVKTYQERKEDLYFDLLKIKCEFSEIKKHYDSYENYVYTALSNGNSMRQDKDWHSMYTYYLLNDAEAEDREEKANDIRKCKERIKQLEYKKEEIQKTLPDPKELNVPYCDSKERKIGDIECKIEDIKDEIKDLSR